MATFNKVCAVYNQTKPLVAKGKRPRYGYLAREALSGEEEYQRFAKISYAIRLMSKGIKISAFKAMFRENIDDLELAQEFAQKNEKVFDNLEK